MPIFYSRLSPYEFSVLCPQLVSIYIRAMSYGTDVHNTAMKAWRIASLEKDFQSVIAHDASHLLGFCFGHRGARHQWWDQEIRRGLREHGSHRLEVLGDYFTISEIHVEPRLQGLGIGHSLLQQLLHKVDCEYAILSTPEVNAEENAAFHLYRNFGFQDVLRDFHFRGDARPFAILSKQLRP
ncbi:GNAT family N-acetyltransferase [Corynebacterium sp. ES2794-CONJ1]|uniref:GNAT family N-acetyltransferase n=1 Tax=unclassified Corynebacterium TaxID=2624378 RepID=UPI002168818B|nr:MULTISPECIES: GNAT family N-acetyltransferase [unclassified Corynebacterium]MCS4489003.1 GNAT family N-acetyltransferase [Corynebacterium sp. ES2775-CONJ]MCS4490816.1 GNAT family N-acetyltransferase [Corynebacterium sp. ES2715-CONJ3]MCS4531301.1 GNAT family N-acetyltransferase [Corynebacterium sp. ES2730-CONJ]MCU9518670.1 GNAT family N-acetyltransferase [Corynebacterium sp. ES2794-CONJ1]